MPDYSLGRAHGEIVIDFDGSGADKAAAGLDKVAASSAAADASLDKTHKSLGDTGKAMDSAGSSADGYRQRLNDVEHASRDVESAEKNLRGTLLNSKATLDDVKAAEDRVTESKKRHTSATNAARDAHKAFSAELSLGERAVSALASIFPKLTSSIDDVATGSDNASSKASGLAGKLSDVAKVVGLLGPEGKAAAGGLLLLSKGMDSVGGSASSSAGFVSSLVQQIASFEVGFGKIAGLSLGAVSLGGLAGLGGAAGVQGIVELAGAAEQLSGVLGLLPSIMAGVGFSAGTLDVAFRNVGAALKDMMSDDPKKFLEDIKDMAPAAAQALLQVAGFRDQIKLGGAAVQQSFFSQIAADIAPLIQTWLPAIVSGMSQVSGIFGEAAHKFAGLLQQPGAMNAFTQFIANLSAGLKALEPAMVPLFNIFSQLTVVGSSFFGQLGGQISHILDFFSQLINKAASSGQLQAWINDGINAFGHLVNIAYSFGSAFLNIMDIADKFGGGGLLGWLEQLTVQFNNWTSSADGQKTLTDFFTTLRTATDAFTPVLKPLVEGIASIATAFVQLGVASAPGWLTFFNTFAQTMASLAPQIAGMGPAVNTFLTGLASSFGQLVATLGPQLPRIFQDLANAFVALLPQIPQLAVVFIQLVESVGPQLPKFFGAITDLITQLLPYLPELIGFVRDFVSLLTWFIGAGGTVVGWFQHFGDIVAKFAGDVPGEFQKVKQAIENFFSDLGKDAVNWGKKLIDGLINGITNSLGPVGRAAKSIVDEISSWFPQSPAKQGPFSGAGYTYVRGQKMVTDMAAGIASAQGSIVSAASSTAAAASGALSGGGSGAGGSGGAPSPGGASTVGNSLLPDNIAGADTSILTAYLRHQFDDNRGLKGLAKDLGNFLAVAQSGFDLLNTHVMQPVFQALGMMPGSKEKTWHKMTPEEIAAQQQADMQKTSVKDDKPNWQDVLGPGVSAGGGGGQVPLGLSASSSKADIQKAIIAAGRARGMNDAAIQTALATAAAESGFNPTMSGGVQGSAGEVSGLYQQSPSSGWGTMAQVNDPNFAINAFYDAFAKQLAKNPTNPQLAAVLTQNPQLGSGAQGSKYWNDISNQLGLANSIMDAYGKNVTGPTWGQVTGAPAAPGGPPPLPPDAPKPITGAQMQTSGGQTLYNGKPVAQVNGQWYLLSDLAKGTLPGSGWGPAGSVGQQKPQAGGTPAPPAATQGQGEYGLPAGTNTGGYGTGNEKTFPSWLIELGKQFGVTPSTYGGHQESDRGGEPGYAPNPNHENRGVDWVGTREQMQAFANALIQYGGAEGKTGGLEQVIYQAGPGGQKYGLGGSGNVQESYYPQRGEGSYDEHGGTDTGAHVHTRFSAPIALPGGPIPLSAQQAGIGSSATAGLNSGLVLPSGQSLDALTATATQNTSINDKLLQSYLQGNPALAQQINAAQTPGAADQTVMDSLNGINKTITDLQTQDAVGNKNTIEALQSTQTKIASQQGFSSGPSTLSTAQSIAGGVTSGIGEVFKAISSGLDALTATQDIADRLVYGVRNTEDINKIIDDVQKYITYAADILSAAGSITSMVGSFTGGSDFGGTSAAGSMLSMIAGVMQGVNAAIDFGQQVYEITMGYVGKFMSVLTGLGGTDLMGNVGFLLNKNTGQLLSYSHDNPEAKNAANVPSWMNSWYDYNGKGNPNPQVNQQLNVYAGPGQSPAAMMNETMWLVNTQGTTGALQPANF
jgi:hypothetical protein